jgi:2-iminobutanoate/2-iminopropanoate deaminase
VAGKRVIRTDAAPQPFRGSPYSQAIVAGGLVFVAGQIPLRPDSDELVGDAIEEQTEQVLRNVGGILEAAGSSLDLLVRTTVYLVDLADVPAMNEVYRRHVGAEPPARTTFQVAGLPGGARIEIDAVAALPA